MGRRWQLSELDEIPRLGLVEEPTELTVLAELAAELKLESLLIKRDDKLPVLHGGSKPRKLDYLLAQAPFSEAPGWAAVGAIGSGNLVAVTAAAERLDRQLEAHTFWEPISDGVIDNLAYVASGPVQLRYYSSRVGMVLRRPQLITGGKLGELVVLPPGATTARSMVGIVRAALELAEQLEAEDLPPPERVVVALGSGGTAVGLAHGFALAGIDCELVAVSAVERLVSSRRRLAAMERGLAAHLRQSGLADAADVEPVAIRLVRNQLGRGYGIATAGSVQACSKLREHGVLLEPLYTGKAMAALLAGLPAAGGRVLFWNTRRDAELPERDGWRERLPKKLAARLALEQDPVRKRRAVRRRRVLLGAAGAAGLTAIWRMTGYQAPAGFRGAVLADWEAQVLTAVGEAVLGKVASADQLAQIPSGVDRYLLTMPPGVQRELHLALGVLEQATLMGGCVSRFSRLPVADRERLLAGLAAGGGLREQIYRAVRDLCMLGFYQQSSSWQALGYEGPLVGEERMRVPGYEQLKAKPGAVPRGASKS